MLNNVTVDKLRTLKLTGMADEFSEQLKKPMPNLDFEERLGLLIEREWYLRENRRLSRRLRSADFKQQACIEDINYQHSRKLNKEVTKDDKNIQIYLSKMLNKGIVQKKKIVFRVSAKDLVKNHLTMSLFHHAAIWDN